MLNQRWSVLFPWPTFPNRTTYKSLRFQIRNWWNGSLVTFLRHLVLQALLPLMWHGNKSWQLTGVFILPCPTSFEEVLLQRNVSNVEQVIAIWSAIFLNAISKTHSNICWQFTIYLLLVLISTPYNSLLFLFCFVFFWGCFHFHFHFIYLFIYFCTFW